MRRRWRRRRTPTRGVLLSHPEKIGVILGAAENSDMYVRYHATQLLMRLLSVAAARTQEAMLEQPATVAAVVKLLEDKREIVRNEVLLLLAQLSAHNASLQTILAFQGAFDQLIKIIEGELQSGESGAAAVVNDCFAIVSSLLSSSAAARASSARRASCRACCRCCGCRPPTRESTRAPRASRARCSRCS